MADTSSSQIPPQNDGNVNPSPNPEPTPVQPLQAPLQQAQNPAVAQPSLQPLPQTPVPEVPLAYPEPSAIPVTEPVPTTTSVPPVPNSTPAPAVNLPEFMKPAPHQPKVTPEEKLWAFIGYIPFLGLITLIMKPESQYIRLHGKQGLLISLIFFFNIFFYLIPIIQYLAVLVHMAEIVLIAFSMYQALIGNWWKIPVLGDIANVLPVNALVKVSREAVMGEKAQEEDDQNQPPSSDTPLQ